MAKETKEKKESMAWVLVNTELGEEDEILEQLKSIGGVTEAHSVYGVYDIITRVVAVNLETLKEIIADKIRNMEGVRSTLTMIVTP